MIGEGLSTLPLPCGLVGAVTTLETLPRLTHRRKRGIPMAAVPKKIIFRLLFLRDDGLVYLKFRLIAGLDYESLFLDLDDCSMYAA